MLNPSQPGAAPSLAALLAPIDANRRFAGRAVGLRARAVVALRWSRIPFAGIASLRGDGIRFEPSGIGAMFNERLLRVAVPAGPGSLEVVLSVEASREALGWLRYQDLLGRAALVFPGARGTPLSESALQQIYSRAIRGRRSG